MTAISGQKRSALKDVDFDNAQFNSVGVEIMTLAELRRRVPAEQLSAAERVSFHIFFLVTQGAGTHTIDFVCYPLETGSLVSIHPGQVHQWQLNSEIDGHLMIFAPSALNNALPISNWSACRLVPKAWHDDLCTALKQLSHDIGRFHEHALDIALIRQGLIYLLLRIARCHTEVGLADSDLQIDRPVYRLFIQELEKSFHRRLAVHSYAQKLGYSKSTLSRACLDAEGRSAKIIIDRRVALEAERLLTHTVCSVSEIGHQLGFSEVTNFVKFFIRMMGITPTEFRRAQSI